MLSENLFKKLMFGAFSEAVLFQRLMS